MKTHTLYFDGNCQICAAEIDSLKQLCNASLTFTDINSLKAGDCEKSHQQLLSRLHIKTIDGLWLTGSAANTFAWQQTRFKTWARCLELPLIRQITALAYEIWLIFYRLRKRFRRCE